MEQVLINLVVNARDAMPKGGRLVIATAGFPGLKYIGEKEKMFASPYATLSVSDTGIGMDAATQARISNHFLQQKRLAREPDWVSRPYMGSSSRVMEILKLRANPGK